MSYEQTKGHGEKRSRKMDTAISALLSEPTLDAAARKAEVSVSSLKRWQKHPDFKALLEKARREVAQGAVTRLQGSMTLAVKTLTDVMTNGSKDGDRIRAAAAVLQYGFRGVELADALQSPGPRAEIRVRGVTDACDILAEEIARVRESQLGTAESAQLVSELSGRLVSVISTEVLQKRLDALEATLKKHNESQK